MDDVRNALSVVRDLLQIVILVLTARQLSKKDSKTKRKPKRRGRR